MHVVYNFKLQLYFHQTMFHNHTKIYNLVMVLTPPWTRPQLSFQSMTPRELLA